MDCFHSEQHLANAHGEKYVCSERTEERVCISVDMSNDSWFERLKTELEAHLGKAEDECIEDKSMVRPREREILISFTDTLKRTNLNPSKENIEEHELNSNKVVAPTVPKPGTFIPKEWHKLLDNRYDSIESDYKFVAFEIEDPALVEDPDSDKSDDPTYIFVQIKRKHESAATHPLLQEYLVDDGTENYRLVKCYNLYRFAPTAAGNEKKKGTRELSDEEMRSVPEMLSELKDIRRCLEVSWKESVLDRRHIVKRLLFHWQPSRTTDNKICTKAFQYIQECLRRLENGVELQDDDFDYTESKHSTSTEEYWSNSWFGHFWENYGKDRLYHVQNKDSGSFDQFDGGWGERRSYFAGAEPRPYHYGAEARRWQRQAVCDIDNSITSLQRAPNNSFNWVCYMAHQAAEKSMKAAWYARDANKIHNVRYSHNLNSIASGLGADIENFAGNMTRFTGEHTRMRYPDAFYGQQIPADSFNRQTAETVVAMARQIIDIIQRNYIK